MSWGRATLFHCRVAISYLLVVSVAAAALLSTKDHSANSISHCIAFDNPKGTNYRRPTNRLGALSQELRDVVLHRLLLAVEVVLARLERRHLLVHALVLALHARGVLVAGRLQEHLADAAVRLGAFGQVGHLALDQRQALLCRA